MRINETIMYLRLNKDCILDYKLNDNVVINLGLNLNELIYSWSLNITVADFLSEIGSPLKLNG